MEKKDSSEEEYELIQTFQKNAHTGAVRCVLGRYHILSLMSIYLSLYMYISLKLLSYHQSLVCFS